MESRKCNLLGRDATTLPDRDSRHNACNKSKSMKLEKFYPAANQPGTLTAALVDAGHYASISSAGASLARSKKGPPETFEITLCGFREDPQTGKMELVVCTLLLEKTPERFLTEKNEKDEK